ncbi:MAG: family 43 glycosylhydrolase [Oscillospiraceae bacterium]|nr:family 43 glycosylhydrolase [Oscillospiraceae bacterium]
MEYGTNPIIGMDCPDPDVIRVGDTYYMINTTMHFFPGGQILRSYDLIHWEICSYVFDHLEHTAGERLEGGNTIYGHGMWAASLRYHEGRFYVVFIAHEWDKTFLFTADSIEGPWKKSYIEGIYHDPSLLFDDDGRVYIVYGNTDIRLTELCADLSKPKKGGIDRIIIRDAPAAFLGYEGSHLYKINGKYVLFLIHSKPWKWHRTQSCFVTDDLCGVWAGGDVLMADLDGLDSGPAQGGVVDTPEGKWFSIVFQDRGAAGRIPVLIPITWNENGYPVYGEVTKEISCKSTRPGYACVPLYSDDDFTAPKLSDVWQFCHEPHTGLYETGNGYYSIVTDKLSPSLEYARNTITQRTVLPACSAEITADASSIKNGDVAGLCLLIGSYGLIGMTKENGQYFLVMKARETGKAAETEQARITLTSATVRLRADVKFTGMEGKVVFSYEDNGVFRPLGTAHTMHFALDHFTGCRFGLFMYSVKEYGGKARFSGFRYLTSQEQNT